MTDHGTSAVAYTLDADVDTQLDAELRALLSLCFTGPEDAVFRARRYFREPPKHRWLLRDETGALVAQVAVHEKTIDCAGWGMPIGGIADVCVHPDHRGRGHVRGMLAGIHAWLAERLVPFAVLFGDPAVYASSGYVVVKNLRVRSAETGAWEPGGGAMVHELGAHRWPDGPVDLIGPRF